MQRRSGHALLGAALTLALVTAGCGDSSDEATDTTAGAGAGAGTSTSAPATSAAGGGTLAVTGIDYAFTGVPATVKAGTTVTFTNASKVEFHELVALRVKDGETRPVSALLALPEAERDNTAEFRGVALAFPGEPGVTPEGPVVLGQPGRYVFVCTIPVGADPNVYREAMKNPTGPPPTPAGGPPHVARGMVSELTVT